MAGELMPTATPLAASSAPALSDAFRAADAFTAHAEGGFTSNDGTGHVANFGIDQNAHPDINVKTLTPQAAQQIRHQYWTAIGGDRLAAINPGLATAAYDTAIMAGPNKTKEILTKSGDDPNKFMALRSEFLTGLGQKNPERYGAVQDSWAKRTELLNQQIGTALNGTTQVQPEVQFQTAAVMQPSAPSLQLEAPSLASGLASGIQAAAKGGATPKEQAPSLAMPQVAPLVAKSQKELYGELLGNQPNVQKA